MIKDHMEHNESKVWRQQGTTSSWRSSGCRMHECQVAHPSFLEAVRCCYAGRQTLKELGDYLSSQFVTLQECISENEEGTLLVLRDVWMAEYLTIQRNHVGQIGNTQKRHKKPTALIQKNIFYLQRLIGTLSPWSHFKAAACLQEATGQFENLLAIPTADW